MMAISALSLADRNGTQIADALEHYQQALPAMRELVKSEEDYKSDGALFTHYLLLLYEVSKICYVERRLVGIECVTSTGIITCRSLSPMETLC